MCLFIKEFMSFRILLSMVVAEIIMPAMSTGIHPHIQYPLLRRKDNILEFYIGF